MYCDRKCHRRNLLLYIIKISEHGQQKIKHTEAANDQGQGNDVSLSKRQANTRGDADASVGNGLQQESQETSKNNPHAALQGKNNPSTSAVNNAGGRNNNYTPQITLTNHNRFNSIRGLIYTLKVY